MLQLPKGITCSVILLLGVARLVSAPNCTCDKDEKSPPSYIPTNFSYKTVAIVAILVSGAAGISLPILGKKLPAFRPESNLFFLIKAFAAGVILSTGFVHILPDAFEDLTNPCLKTHPWGDYPFTGLATMIGALGTLIIDAFATGYYSRIHFGKRVDEGRSGEHDGHLHLHAHPPLSATPQGLSELEHIRHRITSQVLELGIIVHSVIIGITLGTSQSLKEIKSLTAALSFHQCFEGMGLGGCIAQADFKSASTLCMGLFFSLTTPVGVGIGMAITTSYDKNGPTALIVQGLLNSCAAGILIYMALVDLLAQDFMSPKLQANQGLFLASNLALLLGAAFMAALASWA